MTFFLVVEHLSCLILRTALGSLLVDSLLECVPHNYVIHQCIKVHLIKYYNLSLIVTGAGYFHLHCYYTQSTSFSQMDGLDRLLLGFFGISCLLLLISGIVYVICLTCHSIGLLPPRFSNKVNFSYFVTLFN